MEHQRRCNFAVKKVPVRRDDPSSVEEAEMEEERVIPGRRGGAPSRAVGGGGGGRQKKRARVLDFIDYEAEVDEDEEEEDGDGEEDDDFIDERPDLGNESEQRMRGPAFITDESEEEVDEIERRVLERYTRWHSHMDEDANEVEQQALLPILSDPKLWLVKCAIGHEREVAIRLMRRFVDRKVLRITSALALDHLKSYIYVEARKLADVKEALAGLGNVFSSRDPQVVPLEEMTTVFSVENKTLDIMKGSFVRMRRGDYKGDLAQVVAMDDLKREVTVKIVPRIDLRYLAEKSAAKASGKVLRMETSVPPQKLFNKREVRNYRNLTLYKKADINLGDGFVLLRAPSMPELMFKDGFLYKKVSMKLVSMNFVQPTHGELERFIGPQCDASGNIATTFASRKHGYFVKGDAVIVIRGDLKNLEGWVQKVEGDIVHIRPKIAGLPETISFNEKELCKYFMPGEEIKVVSGILGGASGMVVKMDGHVLSVLSHTTKQHVYVFADHAVRSTEFTKPTAQIGGFELNDLVKLNDNSFGVIIRLENEGLEIFQGVPDQPKVRAVNLRDIKNKIYRCFNSKDRSNNVISANDIVRVIDGPLKGKQGKVQHIFNGMLFIHHPYHTEHAGLICTRAHSCLLVGGLNYGNVHHAGLGSQLGASSPSLGSQIRGTPGGVASSQFSGWRFRGCERVQEDLLLGKIVKVKFGPYKGYRGQVVGLKNNIVRVELESIMRTSNFSRDQITDASDTAAPALREGRSLPGARTPIHQSRRPLMQTPTRDVGAIPMLGGMRTATGGTHGARNQR